MTSTELRTWRLERGLTQTVAGRMLGTCERRLREYETGRRPVPDAVVLRVQARTPAPMPVKPQVPAVELDETCRVSDVRRWATRLPSNAEPLAAHALGVPLRVFRCWTTAAPADAPVPVAVADRLRALSPGLAGPYLSRDLIAWRERYHLTPEAAAEVLGVPVDRITHAERKAWAMLPLDLAVALAAHDAA